MTPPVPSPDDAHPFAPYLQEGEELLWVGKPKWEAYCISQSQKTVLAFWWGTVLLFVFSAYTWTGNHRLAILATVVSFATWWIVFAVPLFERKQNKRWQRIYYALSNRRVMMYNSESDGPFTAIPFGKIKQITFVTTATDIGTISFSHSMLSMKVPVL